MRSRFSQQWLELLYYAVHSKSSSESSENETIITDARDQAIISSVKTSKSNLCIKENFQCRPVLCIEIDTYHSYTCPVNCSNTKLPRFNNLCTQRLRNWESRERKKGREYEKLRDKLSAEKNEQDKEAKRLKEFLEDYEDERDDPKYYK